MQSKEIFLLTVSVTITLASGGLIPKVRYRIKSGLDGAMLTADLYPKYANDLSLVLGDVTTQDWHNGRNQLWKVYKPSSNSTHSNSTNLDLYWIKPGAGLLNTLTGVPKKEVTLQITDITENSGTFTIRNIENGLCLENQGVGLKTVYKPCNELSTAQQWDFEDPVNVNLQLHIKLFNQLLSIFN